MATSRQFSISRLMMVIAVSAVLFALPTFLSMIVVCVAAVLMFTLGTSAVIERMTGPGPGRPYARENIPALARTAVGLDFFAWLALAPVVIVRPHTLTHWDFERLFGIGILVLGVLSGTVAFVLGLTVLLADRHDWPRYWKGLGLLVTITSVPHYIALMFGTVSVVMWVISLVMSFAVE